MRKWRNAAGLLFDDQTVLHLPPASTSQVYKTERRLSPGRLERSLHRRDLSLHTMSGCPLQQSCFPQFLTAIFPPSFSTWPFQGSSFYDSNDTVCSVLHELLPGLALMRQGERREQRTFDVEKKRNAIARKAQLTSCIKKRAAFLWLWGLNLRAMLCSLCSLCSHSSSNARRTWSKARCMWISTKYIRCTEASRWFWSLRFLYLPSARYAKDLQLGVTVVTPTTYQVIMRHDHAGSSFERNVMACSFALRPQISLSAISTACPKAKRIDLDVRTVGLSRSPHFHACWSWTSEPGTTREYRPARKGARTQSITQSNRMASAIWMCTKGRS